MSEASRKAALYLALAFAITWAIAIGGWALGAARTPQIAVMTLAVSMVGPAVAALICAVALEPKGTRRAALGLHWTPNLWWLFAWAFPIALAAAALGLSIVLGGREYVPLGEAALALARAQTEAANAPLPAQLNDPNVMAGVVLLQAAVIGAAINTVILTLTEELGWRGYLHTLWRPLGFWRCALMTGFVWGLWHAPAILLFGHNYPEHRELGVALFTLYCMLLAPVMTLVRDRGGSVLAAGILHGVLNAVAGLTIITLADASFPWTGIVGVGGMIALAIVCALIALAPLKPKQERPA